MNFSVGSLVKARGREWVVLPSDEEDLLLLRPLGGTDEEITGIYLPLEWVEEASFGPPSPDQLGNWRSCRLLRDAVRLGFRSSAGPFRSFAKIAVEPRPYQLVPLLMALRLDPIRLLIADDVGIGKTVEACLIARELLDRGEISRLAVLCPPHLAEQWQSELREKFHIQVELVLPSTARRLEKVCGFNRSIFEVYPHVVVSLDYIKSDRRRDEFLRTCPELVIVDEAHTCVYSGLARGARHQRNILLKGIAARPDRHLILVTATPHSGKEDAFRRLLAFLNEDFKNLPQDLSGKENEHHRRRLARYFIQRRRADIRDYLDEDTTFPVRKETEVSYKLTPEYKKLFDQALKYARETVRDATTGKLEKRVRWWSALALLRSLASSPEAAVETLRNRAILPEDTSEDDIDERGRRTVLDVDVSEDVEPADIVPEGDVSDLAAHAQQNRKRLLRLARQAEKISGPRDPKLQKGIAIIKSLVKDGFNPVVFCRFIPTAEYVAKELKNALRGVEVIPVTGLLPPEEREMRVEQLSQAEKRILVCTDCLSEGINLQERFDAVVHYDLSWNPTRHEQREGRVDRFGQPRDEVRVVTLYGMDNQIDGIILDVLIRKHKKIKSSLGISVPVPVDTNQVVETIFEGLLLREQQSGRTPKKQLELFEDFFRPNKERLFEQWENVTEKEKRSRTLFAQRTIKPDEVARELASVRKAIGSSVDISGFMQDAVKAYGGIAASKEDITIFNLDGTPQALKDMMGVQKELCACFKLPVHKGAEYLQRTHPAVEGLATYVMDTALDPKTEGPARRCGVVRTSLVKRKTVLVLTRFRFHIITFYGGKEQPILAEDVAVLGFSGSGEDFTALSYDEVERLLEAEPDANVPRDIAVRQMERVLEGFDAIKPWFEDEARVRAKVLLEAHRRVRTAAKIKGVTYRVEPNLPPDVLGVYVYLPVIS